MATLETQYKQYLRGGTWVRTPGLNFEDWKKALAGEIQKGLDNVNKPYFTKYLPVEGVIKPGDHGLTDNHKYVFKALKETMSLCKGRQKVKLFLCSRDIQVGDEFTQVGIDMLHPTARFTCTERFEKDGTIDVKDEEGHIYVVVNSDYPDKPLCYKIIGEISPDALSYVEEGQKFNDSEVKAIKYEKLTNDPDDWTGAEYETVIAHYEIKGPCGHFH